MAVLWIVLVGFVAGIVARLLIGYSRGRLAARGNSGGSAGLLH